MKLNNIEELTKLDLKRLCYDDLMKCLFHFMPDSLAFDHRTFHPPKTKKEKYFLERGRMNDNFNFPFCTQKDISYRTDNKNIKYFGRANRPHSPMWYGSFGSKDIPTPVATIFGEMKAQREAYEQHDFTIGRWEVINDLNLVNIVSENDPKFNDLKRSVYEQIENDRERQKIIDVTKFIAREFSKPVNANEDYNYKISVAFTDIILNNSFQFKGKKTRFDGIIYPSIQIKGKQGINVVIKPESVDTCLKLTTALCYEFHKEERHYKLYTPAKLVAQNADKNENFNWKNIN